MFSQAHAKLSLTAIHRLNDWLIARAERDRFVPRWRGLRLVAADASTLRFGLRASHVKRAAIADQILFGLFLPGPDLMRAASLHSVQERGERQFLFEHLDRLSPDDLRKRPVAPPSIGAYLLAAFAARARGDWQEVLARASAIQAVEKISTGNSFLDVAVSRSAPPSMDMRAVLLLVEAERALGQQERANEDVAAMRTQYVGRARCRFAVHPGAWSDHWRDGLIAALAANEQREVKCSAPAPK